MTKKNGSKVEQQIASQNWFCERAEALEDFARTHPEELASREFGPSEREAFSTALFIHKKNTSDFQLARGHQTRQKRQVKKEVGKTLDFRLDLTVGFDGLRKYRGEETPPVRRREVIGTDPHLCLVWLTQVRPDVTALAVPLTPFMGGDPLVRLDSQEARLTTAVVSLHEAKASLEERREALLKSRAALTRLIELLRISGRLAFKGQPALLKKLSWRAGVHPRKPKKATPPAKETPKVG
jgi:hypothetical protein